MPNMPEPSPAWNDVPMIETTDRVLGGASGPVNVQAREIVARTGWLRAAVEDADDAAAAAQASATAANTAAGNAATQAASAGTAASAAQASATAAQTTANTAVTNAAAAQSTANAAGTAAAGAQTTANTANTAAANAQATANSKSTRVDLGTVSIAYTAALAVGAGSRSVEANCAGAVVGDALIVVATAAIADGYAIGAGQCITVGKVRVSVSHPALVLGANFSIPVHVYAMR